MATLTGLWVIRDKPNLYVYNSDGYIWQNNLFATSNGKDIRTMQITETDQTISYATKEGWFDIYADNKWVDEAYKILDFGEREALVSDEFYTWFTANAVSESAEEPETVTQYLIRSDTLTAIADRTREMAGTNKKLTPADIIYWLGRVKFIPQGWATSEFTLDFDCGASGVLPVVVKGTASSEFTLNFESSAVGALQEG